MTRELKETEQTLDNISTLLYEASKPADTLAKKFGETVTCSKKMEVVMRFLSGTGAWKFLNKVKALGMLVDGYYKNLDSANEELRQSAKLYAEQIGHMEDIMELYKEGTTELDTQKLMQSDLYKGLEDMYGQEYALLKIKQQTNDALTTQADKMEKIKRSNMQNADILAAIEHGGLDDDAKDTLLGEATRRGLGKVNEETGEFEEFGPFEKFVKIRLAMISLGIAAMTDFVDKAKKIIWDFLKKAAKFLGMALLYIGLFIMLMILLKPFFVRVYDTMVEMKKAGSETLKYLGIFWENLKERLTGVWNAASGFIKILFDKEATFMETLKAFGKLVLSLLKLVIGTLLDLIPVAFSLAMELLVVLITASVKLLWDVGAWIVKKIVNVAIWTKDWLTDKLQWLGEFIKGKSKKIFGAVLGGAIGFAVGGPAGAALGAGAGYGIAGKLATGGIAGKSGTWLVGEKGPELVSLPRGAKVTPNHQIRNTGGNTIHVHVSGRVGASDQEIRDIARKVGAQISREINRTTTSGMRA